MNDLKMSLFSIVSLSLFSCGPGNYRPDNNQLQPESSLIKEAESLQREKIKPQEEEGYSQVENTEVENTEVESTQGESTQVENTEVENTQEESTQRESTQVKDDPPIIISQFKLVGCNHPLLGDFPSCSKQREVICESLDDGSSFCTQSDAESGIVSVWGP